MGVCILQFSFSTSSALFLFTRFVVNVTEKTECCYAMDVTMGETKTAYYVV